MLFYLYIFDANQPQRIGFICSVVQPFSEMTVVKVNHVQPVSEITVVQVNHLKNLPAPRKIKHMPTELIGIRADHCATAAPTIYVT